MMKFLFAAMLALAIAVSASAQTPTYTIPESVTSTNFFNAVTTAQSSSNFTNLGQTVHFLFYTGTGSPGSPTGVQIRLEGSFDGTTYFAISDDGTDPGPAVSNLVLGIGAYPFIRANLLSCTNCNATNSITASYFGTSSMPGNPFGLYGAGQQIRKVIFLNTTTGTLNSTRFVTPYGSTAGFLTVSGSNAYTNGNLNAKCLDFAGPSPATSFSLIGVSNSVVVPISPATCNLVQVNCQACANSGGTTTIEWFFYPPGATGPPTAEPPNTKNTEATAGTNTAVVTTLTVTVQRAHLFSVNASCSAGTASLTVADGATTIWSSAATEVGTTSFTKAWNPGLASTPANNLVITLGTCGVGNTGKLDVQGSVF